VDTANDSPAQLLTAEKIILIIEDDKDIGQTLVDIILHATPYRAVLAANSYQAFQFLRGMTPCLVIVDYQLPVIDGLRFYDIFHGIDRFKTVPAILITASPSAIRHPARERHLPLISKPFYLKTIVEKIEATQS
jgi:CheY-like chemotaxis protein